MSMGGVVSIHQLQTHVKNANVLFARFARSLPNPVDLYRLAPLRIYCVSLFDLYS
jgi:hypothetical protein